MATTSYTPEDIPTLVDGLTAMVAAMHIAHVIHDEELFQAGRAHIDNLCMILQQIIRSHPDYFEPKNLSDTSCPLCPLWLKVSLPC